MAILWIYLFAQAQTPTDIGIRAFASEAADKDFRWWFAILFGILIVAGTVVFRQLIKQLAEQRESNASVTKEFITNMKDDRLKQMVLLERVTIVLEKIEEDKRMQILLARHREDLPPAVKRAIREHEEGSTSAPEE